MMNDNKNAPQKAQHRESSTLNHRGVRRSLLMLLLFCLFYARLARAFHLTKETGVRNGKGRHTAYNEQILRLIDRYQNKCIYKGPNVENLYFNCKCNIKTSSSIGKMYENGTPKSLTL
jgi:hypothetical protein